MCEEKEVAPFGQTIAQKKMHITPFVVIDANFQVGNELTLPYWNADIKE
tara:strand:- start:2117 stop:2263 length:147 start_codon:yes stop_codon:yes gene_type:complete